MGKKGTNAIDPDDVRKAIYLIDSYRAHIFYDISWIDKKVSEGTLGSNFKRLWKDLRKRMIKMASISNRIPNVKKLVKIQSYLEAIWQISIPLIVMLFFLSIFAPESTSFLRGLSIYLIILAFSSLMLGLVGRFIIGGKIGSKINEHFKKNPEAHKFANYEVKEAVQLLIEELRIFLRVTSEKPKKHLIGISFIDYNGIKIEKKPKPWRKYYLAKVVI